MKKIILFTGGVETLDFFSLELSKTFRALGHDIFIFDYNKEAESSYRLLQFYEKDNTVVLSFNYHGMCNENILRDESAEYIWDGLGIHCYNIIVDHPFYYDRFMPQLPKNYTHISIDLNHLEYMKRFYPHISNGPFLPLGGTLLSSDEYGAALPIKERPIDIVFTGSWAEPEYWEQYMYEEGPEYAEFYHKILNIQLDNPDLTFEEIFEPAIRAEAEDADEITDEALRETYAHLICFDMYVRYYFRGELIKALADSGLKITCIGGGWEHLKCSHPENITCFDYTNSLNCLLQIRQAKVSVNVMPWFKRGAHDRIFNSMLQGAVCFTDSSEYLDTILKDNENCIMWSLNDIPAAAEKLKMALQDTDRLQRIADKGYELALSHTWAERAKILSSYIENDRFSY